MHEILDSGNTVRFHTMGHTGQSVAAHSWGVVVILLEICNPSARLMKAAIWHDCAELHTGDIPAHVKWVNIPLHDALMDVESRVEEKMGVVVDLPEEEARLLKYADTFECMYYAIQQVNKGDKTFKIVYERLCNWMNNNLDKASCGVGAFYSDLRLRYKEATA